MLHLLERDEALHRCCLETVPGSYFYADVRSLMTVIVSRPELARVKSIKSIVLDGNPIKSIRRDIIGKGTAAIMEHLLNRLGESPDGAAEAETYAKAKDEAAVVNQAKFG